MISILIETTKEVSMSSQTFTVKGNLGKTPELKITPNEKTVTNFSIALNRGENENPEWLQFEAWGKTAETIAKNLKKGDRVLVEFEISTIPNQYSYKLVAREVGLINSGITKKTQKRVTTQEVPFV